MSIDFNFSVNILEKEYILKELSFLNYRNLVKSLLDSNEKNINLAFNNLLQFSCVNIKPVNSIEKFLILLKIRSVCVNESIQITTDNIRLNLYVNDIFSKINTPYKYFEYEVDGNIYYFDFPTNLTHPDNIIDFVVDCLVKINDTIITSDIKQDIQRNLPALPINDIYKQIINHYTTFKYPIPALDYTINFFDLSAISFLRSIFFYDLQNLYDIEYTLRKHLHYTADDFKTFSLPECNIMINNINKEYNDLQKDKSAVDTDNNSNI